MKVKEKKNEMFKLRTTAQWIETISSIIILASIIAFTFFDVNVKMIFIIINLAWFFFAVGVCSVSKTETYLKFLNNFSDDSDFPEDF